MRHLETHADCLKEEGLFRVPGRAQTVQAMYDRIMAGESVELDNASTHDVGGLLKMLLREMRIPIFPFAVFSKLMELEVSQKNTEWIPGLRSLIRANVTSRGQAVLEKLLHFIGRVAEYEGASVADELICSTDPSLSAIRVQSHVARQFGHGSGPVHCAQR